MLANEQMLMNYRLIQDENRRLYNQVQDLQGNIRVFCRCAALLIWFSCSRTSILAVFLRLAWCPYTLHCGCVKRLLCWQWPVNAVVAVKLRVQNSSPS